MSVKKNLTVAGLAALLAVPAFTTNKVGHIRIPYTTMNAHASQYHEVTLPRAYWGSYYTHRQYGGGGAGPNGTYIRTPYYVKLGPNGGYYHSTKDDQDATTITNDPDPSNGYKYLAWPKGMVGKSQSSPFGLLSNGELKYAEDVGIYYLHKVHHHNDVVPPTPTPHHNHHVNPVNPSDNGDHSIGNKSTNSNPTNTLYNNDVPTNEKYDSSNNVRSENTQSKDSKKLPQTGEVNHQVSELAASIVLGATGIGLDAMSMKKHKRDKDIANITPIQTNSSSNNNRVDNIIDTLGNEANKLNGYIHKMSNK